MQSARTTTIQFAQVPVTLGSGTEWRSIYFLPLNNVISGDQFMIYSEGQIRNDLGYNLELAQILEIKTTVSGGAEPVDGIFQGPINGWNVDSTMHYGRFSKSDIFTATNNYDVLYLVSRIRCRSTSAVSGNSVTVNLGQGCMYYMKF